MDAIAVDFGATYTRFAVVSSSGKIRRKIVTATPKTIPAIRAMFKRGFSILRQTGVSAKTPLGIASIGPLSSKRGLVLNTPNLGGLSINLKEIVESFHRGPFALLNDCNAAAWGEKVFGVKTRLENLVYIAFGTGLGGGAVVDGNLLLGKDGNAVEIGHIVVDTNSRVRCGCGGIGHWEAFCSGTGLPKLAAQIVGKRLWKTSWEIFESLPRDGRARKVVAKMAEYNAAGYASVINTFDPEILVVGGGLALSHPRETLEKPKHIMKKYQLLRTEIQLSSLGQDAALLGAAAYVLKNV
uniref:Glucokinase n=1 Tax=Caldiarchaeum subterraneum TaxID=311458 RepID=E6N7D6_CALS0|nr:glucokinase [Candidatus Caldarchaeum subterraneum]